MLLDAQDALCNDITNSLLDHKLPLAGLRVFSIEVTLSEERI